MIPLMRLQDDTITPDVSDEHFGDDTIDCSRMIALPQMYQINITG
jgi:hypothetical protein